MHCRDKAFLYVYKLLKVDFINLHLKIWQDLNIEQQRFINSSILNVEKCCITKLEILNK